MRLKLDLDQQTLNRLIEVAVNERRPIAWQAEVLLRRVLGLPAPTEDVPSKGDGGPSDG